MLKTLKRLAGFSANPTTPAQRISPSIELSKNSKGSKGTLSNHEVTLTTPDAESAEIKKTVEEQKKSWSDLSQTTSKKIQEALDLISNKNWDEARLKNNELTGWLQYVGNKLQLQQITIPEAWYQCEKVNNFLLTLSQSVEKDFEEIGKASPQEVKEALQKKISISLEVLQQVSQQSSVEFRFGAAKQATEHAVKAIREAAQSNHEYLRRAWNIRASCQWEKAQICVGDLNWQNEVVPLNTWDQAAEFAIKTFQRADEEQDQGTKNALQLSGLYELKSIEEEKENPKQFRESKRKEHLHNARDAASQAVAEFSKALDEKSENKKRELRENGHYYLQHASLWDKDLTKAATFTRAHYEQELYNERINKVVDVTGNPTWRRGVKL